MLGFQSGELMPWDHIRRPCSVLEDELINVGVG